MAFKYLTLRYNADSTLTVRYGRAVEHISLTGKTKGQVFDCVKYAAISKGVYMPDIELVALFDAAWREAA